jgi:hypothetical protein
MEAEEVRGKRYEVRGKKKEEAVEEDWLFRMQDDQAEMEKQKQKQKNKNF